MAVYVTDASVDFNWGNFPEVNIAFTIDDMTSALTLAAACHPENAGHQERLSKLLGAAIELFLDEVELKKDGE